MNNKPYLLSWNGGATGYSEVQDEREDGDYSFGNIYSGYTKTISDHYFKVMGSFNAELFRPSGVTGLRTDPINSNVPSPGLTQDNQKANVWTRERAIAGFFGRVNYNYRERYMLEANLRYDGPSWFVGDKRWGLFPSLSAGWSIAREDFFRPLAGTTGTLRLKGSWGRFGNNNTDKVNTWYPFYQNMIMGSANSGWLIDGKKQNTA